MEYNGDSYFYCQMIIDDDSLPYLEENVADEEKLKPLYERFNTALILPLKDSLEIKQRCFIPLARATYLP